MMDTLRRLRWWIAAAVLVCIAVISAAIWFGYALPLSRPAVHQARPGERTLGGSAIGARAPLRVCVYNFVPLVTHENGVAAGFFIDLLDNVAQSEGWALEYQFGSFSECMARLADGEVDLLPSMAPTPERETLFDFTADYYFLDWGLIYHRWGSGVESLFDLQGKTIGALKGSVYTAGLRSLLEQFGLQATLVEFDEYTQVMQAIVDGRVDAGICTNVYGLQLETRYAVQRTQIVFAPTKIGFAVAKGKQPEVLAALDRRLQALKASPNSYFYERYNAWLALARRASMPGWARWGAAGLAIGLVVIFMVFMAWRTLQLRAAVNALQASEAKFRQVTEAIREVFWLSSADWRRIDYISPAYEEVWGRSCAELYGQPFAWVDAVVAEDRTAVAAAIPTQIGPGERIEFPLYRIRRPDGTLRWIAARAFGIADRDGTVRRVAGIAEDVTERQLVEQQNRFLASLVAQVTDAVISTDLEWHIISWNAAAERMYGWSAAEVIGRSLLEVTATVCQEPGLTNAAADEIFQKQGYWNGRVMQSRRDGSTFPVSASLTLRRNEAGRADGMVMVNRDIAERLREERSLRESERRLSATLENVQLIAVCMDTGGRVTFANDYLLTLTGWSREEAMGRDWFADFLPPEVGPLVRTVFVSSIGTGAIPTHFENEMVTRSGEHRQVRWNNTVLHDADGAVIGTASIGEDVTERQRAEQIQREYAARLEADVLARTQDLAAANVRLTELDRLKSRFISNVSHELRTPVTNLMLHIHLLEHGKPEKQVQYVRSLKEQVQLLSQLVEDVLNLSRLEMNRDRMIKVLVDLNEVAREVLRSQQSSAETAGLLLLFEPTEPLPVVPAERGQITRAITNLVSNAIKYTQSGQVRVSTLVAEGRVCLAVEDTGMGISAEDLPHLGERFYRGQQSHGSRIPGTGLGLAIVKEILDLHHGELAIDSQPGVGSQFRIWLPVAPDQDGRTEQVQGAQ